jgi:hypothetical protein
MTKDGKECARWDSVWIDFYKKTYLEEGLDENYCRSPFVQPNGPGCYTSVDIFNKNLGLPKFSYCQVPTCNPCSCMPKCGLPKLSTCGCPSVLQAEECCDKDDTACRCGYLKEVCHVNLKNNSTDFCNNAWVECCKEDDTACRCGFLKEACCVNLQNISTDFCYDAEVECCGGKDDQNCRCAVYKQMCFKFPSKPTCEFAAGSC